MKSLLLRLIQSTSFIKIKWFIEIVMSSQRRRIHLQGEVITTSDIVQ